MVYLEQRQRELEDISKITNQIKDISENMNEDVLKQGGQLSKK